MSPSKIHIVQSPEWGEFKTAYGTTAVRVENIQYTKHKIPFLNLYYANSPKVNPFEINFEFLEKSLRENNCIAVNFDVPNVLADSEEAPKALEILRKHCVKSPKNTFAKWTVILDITLSLDELFAGMHEKHRYNIKQAQKKGVVVKRAESLEDFEVFYDSLRETAQREKYYIHSKKYYQLIWEIFSPKGMCYILTAGSLDNKPLASWMFFIYDGVLYYPYGGSFTNDRNLHAGNLVAWEGIKLGKELGCQVFDMWGASEDVTNTLDPWWGFTNFKMKFGGRHVEFIDSYDFIINKPLYYLFNFAYKLAWKILKMLKRLRRLRLGS